MEILNRLHSREDLLALDAGQTKQLCSEIREELVRVVSENGGHLASNLGIVELSVAIHKVFDTSVDRLVFDVGHQCYVHKLLTGRYEQFGALRTFGGISGFPKPSESVHDAFVAGHASNAVSVALGMARARTLQGQNYHVISIIGDGALTGGLCYEGLNDAGASGEPMIVILNDNGMSISSNVGGIAKHLSEIRMRAGYFRLKQFWRAITKGNPVGRFFYKIVHTFKEWCKRKLIGSNFFNDVGFEYFGPVDGYDINKLTYLLERAKELNVPVLLHVKTKKGKGYTPAEENPDRFHGVPPFDIATGTLKVQENAAFSHTFGETVVQLAAENPKVCAVTAAMKGGTGLAAFAEAFPDRFFDVGIAEGHAVTMAGGLAKQGMIPVVAVYSTFLQRAFDMMLQDVAMQRLHVVFAIDRAGLVGRDGETHQGIFDTGYLRLIPGMTVFCPSNQAELRDMLRKAVYECDGPVAVRYPRGGDGSYTEAATASVIRQGSDCTLISYGSMINTALDAADLLGERGVSAEVLKLNTIKPLPVSDILNSCGKTGAVAVIEETSEFSAVSSDISRILAEADCKVRFVSRDLQDRFITHGFVDKLLKSMQLDAESVAQMITEELK